VLFRTKGSKSYKTSRTTNYYSRSSFGSPIIVLWFPKNQFSPNPYYKVLRRSTKQYSALQRLQIIQNRGNTKCVVQVSFFVAGAEV